MNYKRIIADLLLLATLFLTPWWFAFIVACILSFLFINYIELMAIGLMIDSLYFRPDHFHFPISIAALVLFLSISFIKKNIRKEL
jgi:hypothetical protein